MKTIALKSGKHMVITIGLCGKLHKTKFGQYPMKVNQGERREVKALLFGPAIDPDMLSRHPHSTGLLLLINRNIMILILQNQQRSNKEQCGGIPCIRKAKQSNQNCCSCISWGNLVSTTYACTRPSGQPQGDTQGSKRVLN
jgi:hypothetical protein